MKIYSKTQSYRLDKFGEDQVEDEIKTTHFDISDGFNSFQYEYTRKTFKSEEAWL